MTEARLAVSGSATIRLPRGPIAAMRIGGFAAENVTLRRFFILGA
jgi:hypothetical protein